PRLHRLLARLGLVEPVSREPPREYWTFGRDHAREVNDMWDRTRAILAALDSDVRAHDAHLALLYVPVRFEVNDDVWSLTQKRYRMGRRWDRDVVFERLRAVCEQLGIPLVDPRAELRRQEGTAAPPYYTHDVHWTASGRSSSRPGLPRPRSWPGGSSWRCSRPLRPSSRSASSGAPAPFPWMRPSPAPWRSCGWPTRPRAPCSGPSSSPTPVCCWASRCWRALPPDGAGEQRPPLPPCC